MWLMPGLPWCDHSLPIFAGLCSAAGLCWLHPAESFVGGLKTGGVTVGTAAEVLIVAGSCLQSMQVYL